MNIRKNLAYSCTATFLAAWQSLYDRATYNILHSAGQRMKPMCTKARFRGTPGCITFSDKGIGWTSLCAAWFALEIHGTKATVCIHCGSGNHRSYCSYCSTALTTAKEKGSGSTKLFPRDGKQTDHFTPYTCQTSSYRIDVNCDSAAVKTESIIGTSYLWHGSATGFNARFLIIYVCYTDVQVKHKQFS